MAQLRLDTPEFHKVNTQVVVIVPNGPLSILKFRSENGMPFLILSDKGGKVAERFGIRTHRLGFIPSFALYTPGVFVVDRAGFIRYANYEKSYLSEPDNQKPLAQLAAITTAS
jgi:peroxiredoxin